MILTKRKLTAWLLPVLLAAALLGLTVPARAADYTCTARIPVGVQLNGEADEQFTVTIQGEEGAPVPEQTTLQLSGGAAGAFEGLTYTEPGDYTYTIRQTAGSTQYMTYDDTVYTVVVQVTNAEDGGLTYQIYASGDEDPTSKSAAVGFLNTYAPPADPAPGGDGGSTTAPRTGDNLSLAAPAGLLAGALVALILLAALRRRPGGEEGRAH